MSLEKQFVISSTNISKSAHRNCFKMTIKYYVSMWFSSGLSVISQEKRKKNVTVDIWWRHLFSACPQPEGKCYVPFISLEALHKRELQ